MADATPTVRNAPSPARTDGEKVQQWLLQNYLNYKHADRADLVSLSVQNFDNIADLSYWFQGEIMALSLALSTNSHDRQDDVLVLSTDSTLPLYNLGKGRNTTEGVRSFSTLLYDGILDSFKRWIVVPCSDGTLASETMGNSSKSQVNDKEKETTVDSSDKPTTAETNTPTTATRAKKGTKKTKQPAKKKIKKVVAEEARKKKVEEEEARKKKEEEDREAHKNEKETRIPGEMKGFGTHWGLLIVDKQKKIAHWVDSLVTLKKVNGKWKIAYMSKAAIVAGKILCGIDVILATQDGHEKGKFDASTLKYVPNQDLDNDCDGDSGACGPFAFVFLQHLYDNPTKMEHLKASFPPSRYHSVRFNSERAREEVQRLIQRRAEDGKDVIPFGLTAELLRVLRLLPAKYVFDMARGFGDPTRPRPRGPRAGNNRRKDDEDDKEDDDDDSDGDFGDPPIPKRSLRLAMKQLIDPDILKDVPTREGKYELAHGALHSKQKGQDGKANDTVETLEAKKAKAARQSEERKSQEAKERASKAVEKAAAAAAAKHAMQEKAGMLPPKPTHDPKIQFPKQFTKLPKDFADEKEVPGDDIKEWVAANLELFEQMGLDQHSKHFSKRAAFQALAGVDFENETDARLRKIWLRDTNVFTNDDRNDSTMLPGIIAGRMKEKYNIENVTVPVFTAIPDYDFTEDTDWATVDYKVVREAFNLYDIKKHKSVVPGRTPNKITARAILHVRDGNTFAGASNELLDKHAEEIWVQDTNVFTPGIDFEVQKGKAPKLLNGLHADRIRTRMQRTYLNVNAVNISSDEDSSDDEDGSQSSNGSEPPPVDGSKQPSNDGSNPPSTDGNSPQPVNDTNSHPDNSNKRKHSYSETETDTPAAKQVKLSPPNFLTLDEAHLKKWVDHLKPHPIVRQFIKYEPTRTHTWDEYEYYYREDTPPEDDPAHPKPAPLEDEVRVEFSSQVRMILERVYTTTFQDMQKEDPLSAESISLLHQWRNLLPQGQLYRRSSKGYLKKFLETALMGRRGYNRDLPDYSRDRSKWPEYWRKRCKLGMDGSKI
jgi:hypothetical protein